MSLAVLPGCRYSDTLLEVIIDTAYGVEDPHAEPVYEEAENAPVNPDLASVRLAENDNLADQSAFLPVYKEDAPANGYAVRRVHEEQVVDDIDASEGDEQSESEEAPAALAVSGEEEGQGAGVQDQQDEEQTSEEGSDNETDATAGRGGTAQVYGDGTYEELPDAGAVAAKGPYALIVQMLAGKGGLAAADTAWLGSIRQTGAFPDEGLDAVPAVWGGDGALDVDALIASEADTLLVDGVDVVITDAQRDRLLGEGINIVYVPHLGEAYTADSDIVAAVKLVGQVLSGLNSRSTYDTAQMVERYLQLHDTALNGCLNANGGYSYKMVAGRALQGIYQGTGPLGESTTRLSANRVTTAVIDSWTTAAASSMTANREFGFHEIYLNGLTMDTSDGVGLSATTVGGSFVLSDYYLQVAGIVNNAYDTAKPVAVSADSQQTLPYAVTAGSGEGVAARLTGGREVPSALWFSETGVNLGDHWAVVGDEGFPGVIARDSDIAQRLVRSAAKVNGLYNVGQPYLVYEAPAGIAGSWLDGTTESFLLSLWAHGVFLEGGTGSLKEWADGYYQLFYRISDGAYSHMSGVNAVLTAACPTG